MPTYLSGLRQLCDQHDVVLIFDEVVTGFRASPGGAQALYGITPDLTTMAKIVAGALPGGAVGGKADIVDMIAQRGDPDWDNTHRVYHPGTFNGNPALCRRRRNLPGDHRGTTNHRTRRRPWVPA